MKQRILLLDLFRIISAFIVFVFHLNTHFGFVIPDALGLNPIIKTGAVFMVLFFMLSGFGLTISSNTKYSDGWNLKNYKDFIVRRLLNIMPLYYVFLIWVFITKYSWTNTIEEMFSLLPSFITLTQAFFPATFNRLGGGGGTWFLSVLLFMYICFPMIDYFLRSISSKLKLFILMAVLILVTIYPGIVKAYWGGTFAQIYANPIFRLPEFIIGMCVAQICLRKKERHFVRYSTLKTAALFSVLLISIDVLYYRTYFNNVLFEQNYFFITLSLYPYLLQSYIIRIIVKLVF